VTNLYLLATSPRLPAGVMTAQAWDLIRTHPVFAGVESETVEAVRSAGEKVTIIDGAEGLDGSAAAQAQQFRDGAIASGGSDPGAVWLVGADGDQDFARALGQQLLRPSGPTATPQPQLELVYGSWDPPGARLLDVVEVMNQLRSPGGCPWDAEQTHASLLPYLLEEAYEAYDAVQSGNRDDIIEELGDVLLQAVFHARLAEDAPEGERWNIDDVAASLVNKLLSRHPHVFAGESVTGSGEVLANWEQIKHAEKSRSSALDGVARSQPALSLARKYLSKAGKFGLDVSAPALPSGITVPADSEQLGDLLLAIVAEARELSLDAEAALRDAADRYAGRVRAAEAASTGG